MATLNPVIDNTFFAGGVSQEILTQSIFAGVMPNLMTPKSGLKSAISIRNLVASAVFSAYAEDFGTVAANANIAEKQLIPQLFDSKWVMGNEALRDIWGVETMPAGAAAGTLQARIVAEVMRLVMEDSKYKIDDMILNGDTTSLTPHLALMDGFLKLWTANANVKSLGNAALTSANLKDTLDAMLEFVKGLAWGTYSNDIVILMNPQDIFIAKTLRGQDETRLFVSSAAAANTNISLDFLYESKYPVVEVPALGRGKIIIARKRNMLLGYDVLGDYSNFRVENLYPEHDRTIGRAKFYMGWQYIYDNEIVTYGLKAAN